VSRGSAGASFQKNSARELWSKFSKISRFGDGYNMAETNIVIMHPSRKRFSFLILALLVSACQGCSQPTREQLISDLKSVHELLSNGDCMAATEHFKGPDGVSKERLAEDLSGLPGKQELSVNGIQILEKEGKFGKLSEIFPERGER
jgi:hypothetical protein